MNKEMNLMISAGTMYQEWMGLIDLVEEDTSNWLNEMVSTKGWRIVEPSEALDMGFDELVEWSQSETDILVLVDENYLVCLPKKEFHH